MSAPSTVGAEEARTALEEAQLELEVERTLCKHYKRKYRRAERKRQKVEARLECIRRLVFKL